MADITINIRALDLTKGAVDSALRSLRKLTSQARVDSASSTVGSAFRNLAKDVERYQKMSGEALRKEIRERQTAINTLTSMEARYRLHLMKTIGDAERADTRSKLRRIAVLKGLVTREIAEAHRALREKERAEAAALRAALRTEREKMRAEQLATRTAEREAKARAKAAQIEEREKIRSAARAARAAEREEKARVRAAAAAAREILKQEKTKEREERAAFKAKEKAAREAAREEDRIRRESAAKAKEYLKKVEAEEKSSISRRKAVAESLYRIGGAAMRGVRRMGFNAIFAGSVVGSQASMLGSQLGGALGSLGGSLSSGFTNLGNIPSQLIGTLGKLTSVAVRAAGSVASLYTNIVTGLWGTLTAAIPSIGIFISGVITGAGNMAAGAMRMVTDLVVGAVDLVTGALQGIVNTVQAVLDKVISAITGILSGITGFVGSVLGKVGELAGAVFGRIVDFGVSTFETMIAKIAEFKNVMVDVFTQVPEYGAKKFEYLTAAVEDLADRLPVAKKQLAKALFEVVSTQLTNTPEEAMQVLTATSEAAVAGGHDADLVSTTKAATAVLSAFNLKADSARGTLSKLLKAAALGRFAFADLAEGIQNVSGIAANFQTSLDDLLTAYVLASQSMAKQSVPIGVKNLILSLAAPTAEAGKAMKAFGISLKEYTGAERADLDEKSAQIEKLEALIDVYERLHHKTDEQKNVLHDMRNALRTTRQELVNLERKSGAFVGVMEAVRRVQAANLKPEQMRMAIPERRALAAITAIISAMDRADKTSKAISEDSGQQLSLALEMRSKVLTNQIAVLSNVWENTWKGIYNFTEPILADLAGLVAERLKGIRSVIADSFTTEEVASFRDAVSEALSAIANAVFDGVEWIIKNWRRIRDTAVQVWGEVVRVAKAAWNILKFIADAIKNAFGGGEELGKKVRDAFEFAVEGAKNLYNAISKIADGNLEPLIGLIENIRLAWAELTDFMRASFADALMFLEAPLNEVANKIQELQIKALNPFDAMTKKSPREAASDYQYAYPTLESTITAPSYDGGFDAPFKRMFEAFGIDQSASNKSSLWASIRRQVKGSPMSAGLYDSNSATQVLMNALTQFTGHKAGPYGDLRNELKDMPEMQWFAEVLSQFKQSYNTMEKYGFESHQDKMSAFGKTFDFSGFAKALRDGDAPRVREEIEKARAERAREAEAARRRDDLLKALGAKGPTGAIGYTGSAGKTSKPAALKDMEDEKDSEALDTIADHTGTMADAFDDLSTAPTISDPESLLNGALAKEPAVKTTQDLNALLSSATSMQNDSKPKKGKKGEEDKPIRPSWWPADMDYTAGPKSKDDIKKIYRSYNRETQAKAFMPWGRFGIQDGPGHPTLGAPMRDKDGFIVGFRDFQGPNARQHRTVGDMPEPKKRASWKDGLGRTAEELAAARAQRQERERQDKLDKLTAMRKAVEITGDARNYGAFLPEGEQRRKAAKKTAENGFPTSMPDASGVKDVAAKTDEATAAITALGSAMGVLLTAQTSAASGTLTFTEAQTKALADVGIAVSSLVTGLEANNARIVELVLQIQKEINDRLKAIEDKTRQAQVAKGI